MSVPAPKATKVPHQADATRTYILVASAAVTVVALLATGYRYVNRTAVTTPFGTSATPQAGAPPAAESLVQLAEEAETLSREQAVLTRQLQDALARYQSRSGGALPKGIGAELTAEQRALLSERLKSERMGTASLLQDLLAKDSALHALNKRLAEVNSRLPDSVVAEEGQRHERIAMDYLAKQGLSTEQAYSLVSPLALTEPLVDGFRVFLLYENNQFATWVTQGAATVSPKAVRENLTKIIESERDAALTALEQTKADRDDLRNLASAADRSRQVTQADLDAMMVAAEREREANSTLRYVIGSKSELVKAKVIDGSYRLLPVKAEGIALGASDRTTLPPLDPAAYGLRKFKRVTVVPGLVAEGVDYSLTNVDGFVSVSVLRPDRFAQYAKYFVVVLE